MGEIDRMLKALKNLEKLDDTLVKDMADVVRDSLNKTIAAGQDPDGKPWAKRKKGTKPVLVHAADALTVLAVGEQVLSRVRGPTALHSKGAAKGKVERRVLPYGSKIPKSMLAGIHVMLKKKFDEVMGGKP